MKIKTTMRYPLPSIRMAIIKKSANDKSWRGYGEKGIMTVDGTVTWYNHCRR